MGRIFSLLFYNQQTWFPKTVFQFQAKEIAAIQRSEAPMSKMPRQRGRWSQPTSNIEMTVKSMLDLRQLESFSVSRSPSRDSLSQNSNGDDREEQADLPVHINKVRVVLLWGGECTLSVSVLPLFIISCVYYCLIIFFISLPSEKTAQLTLVVNTQSRAHVGLRFLSKDGERTCIFPQLLG